MAELTREQVLEKYGFDPEVDTSSVINAPVNEKKTLPSLGNAARSLAVGAITAIPDVMALPGVIGAGAGAAYDAATSDKKFLESFGSRLRVDGADKRIEEHITEKINEWRSADPSITEADMGGLLKQYQQTPAFEAFNRSLLEGGVGLAADIKAGVRNLVGDTRSESEKSWVDSALEVIGGSVVGIGPQTAAKLSTSLASNAAGRAVLNNTASRGALRVAEAVTPLTLPLTPGNIALNAGVGVAIDQGLRYAMGDTTAFSENDTTLGGIAATTAAVGVAAAVAAAARGKAGRVTQNIPFPNDPQLEKAIAGTEPGGAALIGGKDFEEFGNVPPKPRTGNTGSIVGDAFSRMRQAEQLVADEFGMPYNMIKQNMGEEAAREAENMFSNLVGAGGRDASAAITVTDMRELETLMQQTSPEMQQRVRALWLASNLEDRNKRIESRYADDIAELTAKQANNGGLSTNDQKKLVELQRLDQLFRSDAPEARRFTPEFTRKQIQDMDAMWRNSPELEPYRQAIIKMNDSLVDRAVQAGMLDPADASKMRGQAMYYVPLQQDLLEGSTGIRRVVRGWMADYAKDKDMAARASSNKSILNSFDPRILDDAESVRITKPIDPMLAYAQYARALNSDINQNTVRRNIIRWLEYDGQTGQASKFMTDNNMQRFEVGNRNEFSLAEVKAAQSGNGNPEIAKIADDPSTVRVYANGKVRFYRFGDPEMAALFRFEPTLFTGWAWMLKKAADMFKMNTTGIGAPAFAPINALYDTTMGALTRQPNRAFGPIDATLRRFMSEQLAKQLLGRVFDPTAYAALPWHALAGMFETVAIRATRAISNNLKSDGVMRSIADIVGPQKFEAAVQRMLLAAERSKTMTLLDNGIMHNAAVNDITKAMDGYSYAASAIPAPLRYAYSTWRDLVNSVHSAPKRQFWAQNHMLLEQKFGKGRIPPREISNLMAETRGIAGDMTRRAGSKMVQQLEGIAPYMGPMRNGVVQLSRSLLEPKMAMYAWPRLTMAMTGIMASFYMMSYWDEESKKEFWLNTPEWMRYRYLHVPTPELLMAWHRGETPAYSPNLIYKMPIGPDLAPIVAGSAAFLRALGVLPNGPTDTATSGGSDLSKMAIDMVMPVFPPAFGAFLAANGAQFDPAQAVAGGRGLRLTQGNPFKKGLQEEVASPLGEMNSTTQRVLAALFGTNGMYLARSYDAFMHAARFDQSQAPKFDGVAPARPSNDYAAGLIAGTTTFLEQTQKRLPDVPLIWKGDEKQYVSNSAADVVREQKSHLQSIMGMRDTATGNRAGEQRGAQNEQGGIVARTLKDPTLIRIGDEIRRWDRSGDYADLKKEYGTLASARRAVESNYWMPKEQRTAKVNELIDKMQENMNTQRMAIMYKEQELEERYGAELRGLLAGQPLTVEAVDRLMRQSIQQGGPSSRPASPPIR